MKTKKNYLLLMIIFTCVCTIAFLLLNSNIISIKADTVEYAVTFHYTDENYEQASVQDTYPAGTVISEDMKYVPCALGYRFTGWDKDGENITGNTDVYAVYGYEENSDDNHIVTKNSDGSITLTNLNGRDDGALIQTYNYYNDFELTFTISDNDTTYSAGQGPMLIFGDYLKYFLASGKDSSGAKRTGVQFQPGFAALIQQRPDTNGANVINGWFNAPMETTVKITVLDNKFKITIDDGSGNFITPTWWSSDATFNEGFVSLRDNATVGTIGFGFKAGSTGSYTISDISIKNLNEKSVLFVSDSINYDISTNNAFKVSLNSQTEIQSVWLGNSPLGADLYYVETESDNTMLVIENSAMRDFIKFVIDDELRLCVYTQDGAYDKAIIDINGFATCVIKFFSGESLISEQNTVVGKSFVIPSVPENSVGWYFNGKRLDKSVIYPSGDMDIYAKQSSDEFNVEFIYRNLRFKEKSETIKVKYGTKFTSDMFKIDEPYGYVFDGWDYSGIITEDTTVTAKYSLYSKAKGFTLNFDGIPKNINYIDYVNTYGTTDLSNNYFYVSSPAIGSGIFTNQKFIDFEMELDVVHYSNLILGDNNFTITFGNPDHAQQSHYKTPYSIVFSLNYNKQDGTYYSTAYLLVGSQTVTAGSVKPFCDIENIIGDASYSGSVSIDGSEREQQAGLVDSGLSPDGKYVNLRLTVQDGTLMLQSKYSDETEWLTTFDYFVGKGILGYLSFGFNTEKLHYGYSIGVDNLSIKNLGSFESGLDISTSELLQNENGVYSYTIGSKDIKTDVNFKMQAYGGTNVIVYDGNGDAVDEISVDIIKEKIYEIGDYITLNKRVLGDIYYTYKQYAKEGKLRVDVILLAELDWGCLPLEISTPETVSLEYYAAGEKISSITGRFGDKIMLLSEIDVPYGNKFGGWVDENGNEIIGELTLIDNIRLTAVFVPSEYTVRFINYDGSAFYSVKVKYGEKAELPIINPLGDGTVEFIEWQNADVIITQDTDITAKWSGSGCAGNVSGTNVFFVLAFCGVFLIAKYIYFRKKDRSSRETL